MIHTHSDTGARQTAGKSISLAELATLLGGRLDGAVPGPAITGIAALADATSSDITFLSDAKNYVKHLEQLKATRAAAVIAPEKAGELPLPSIRFANAYEGFLKALRYFHPEARPKPGIHPTAFVDESANVHPTAIIGPMAVVDADAVVNAGAWIGAQAHVGCNASVGADARLHPGAKLLHGCRVGARSIIHAGAVIGSDGFGYLSTGEGHAKIPQVGNVEIGADVEIGANVTIDRATMGSTRVGDGTKIDNLVHLAHNVAVGKQCIIVAQVGVSGSTVLEDRVTLAGQSGTVGHVTVGRGSTIAARGVVTQDVPPNSMMSGFPLKPHMEEKRVMAAIRKLPELVKTVREIQARLGVEAAEEKE